MNKKNPKKDEPIVGIFTTWNFSLIEKAEAVFKRNLDKNPIYPFEEISPNIYKRRRVKSKYFWAGILTMILTVLIAVAMYYDTPLDQFIVLHIMSLVFSIALTLYYKDERTVILNGRDLHYEFYKKDRLIYRGHYHNIYIRLKGEKSGAGEIFFTITLNGYHIEEEHLTSSSRSMEKLRKLGRRLALRLDLNYFDYMDKSRHHIIRHFCPYASNIDLAEAGDTKC